MVRVAVQGHQPLGAPDMPHSRPIYASTLDLFSERWKFVRDHDRTFHFCLTFRAEKSRQDHHPTSQWDRLEGGH